jgi:hypothetical protein
MFPILTRALMGAIAKQPMPSIALLELLILSSLKAIFVGVTFI